MDKAWMHIEDRLHSTEYAEGVRQFLSMVLAHTPNTNQIRCPCRRCRNRAFHSIRIVDDHFFFRGIDPTYTEWIFHGEDDPFLSAALSANEEADTSSNNDYIDDLEEMLDDIRHGSYMDHHSTDEGYIDADDQDQTFDGRTNFNFKELVADAQHPLYPSCTKFSKLSFIVKLLHIKSIGGWTVKSFDMFIKLLQEAFPNASFPDSYNDARRLERGLGFSYEKIHVYPNDCALFWKENASLDECPKCKASRWEQSTIHQRRVWKDFDNKHERFSEDPRNVRLGLASDGFNPFNNMSRPYSIWPVLLVPYNLPPWAFKKDPYTMLSLLIPSPKSPGNDIDMFLRPLLEELKELWVEGIRTYNAYSGQDFKLHAALLWTINHFLAYANLSSWSTKGKWHARIVHLTQILSGWYMAANIAIWVIDDGCP
ncbi:uncharacterized protein LOC122276915 [Carya illinoinensis]|uniref:uncharacterized protein LOC122276915 n=1 Tax=Carya illinoinensis TaxID=32201 RepID=UPI001C71B938|nr:uncharacterized protein LOC122276915 [Carya illinoinensis]